MWTLTESDLEGIESRAELWFRYGDKTALRAEDITRLVTEVRELHALRRHLMAMNRQATDRLNATESAASPETDPPAPDGDGS